MESLKVIRQTCKVPTARHLTDAEARQRVRALPTPKTKPPHPLPKGYKNELWWAFYNDAVRRGHPDPEKMANSSLRARESTMAINDARHKIATTLDPPKPQETVVAAKQTSSGPKCKAYTLSGKRCAFKAVCGEFCKKHAI